MRQKKKINLKKDVIIKIATAIAMLIVIVIVYIFIKNLRTLSSVKEHEFYQYIMGKKIEYKGNVKMVNKNDITEITTDEGVVSLDSIPIYYNDEKNKVILPKEMAIAFPMENGALYKINSLSNVEINYGDVYIKKGNLKRKLEDAFLYDGEDLYFFIENTTVTIDGEKYNLPPLSYVNATYKGYVEIYNYDTDQYTYIEKSSSDIIAKTSKYTINLSIDSMQYEDVDQLLLKRIKSLTNLQNN